MKILFMRRILSYFFVLLHEGRTLYMCFIAVSFVASCGAQTIKVLNSFLDDDFKSLIWYTKPIVI